MGMVERVKHLTKWLRFIGLNYDVSDKMAEV